MTRMYEPGTTLLLGKYRLEEQIGEGGMGTVWRAVHTTLNRPVAVKFVQVSGPHATEMAERFLREAQLAASVRHRMVVDVVDFGQMPDGTPFMIMELLEGEPLAELMTEEPTLRLVEVLTIFDQLLLGLAAVHDAGIVHRDLKPENVILLPDADGYFPKLTDFGISRVSATASDKLMKSGRRSAFTTSAGVIVGTPPYMSPEQARGLADIDKRTDIWAAGVMLYEATTGRLPFVAEAAGDLIVKILGDEPVPPAELGVPDDISALILRALVKQREGRFQTAEGMRGAVLEALRAHRADGDAPTRSTTSTTATVHVDVDTKRDRGWSKLWIAAGAALVIAGAVAGLVVLGKVQNDAAERTSPEPTAANEGASEAPPSTSSPPRAADGTIHVALTGLPEEATILVDGARAAGAPLELARNGATRVIVVRVDGFEPWEVEHVAEADATYAVSLVPAGRSARARARRAAMRAAEGGSMSMLLRDLDF